jgi:mono/diheme cytochrome c family protein
MSLRKSSLVLVLALCLGGLPSAWAGSKVDPSLTVQEVWAKECKSCHGEDGRADTKMGKKHKVDDLTNKDWQAKHSDEKIKKAIVDGKADTKMKAYGDKLTPEQVQGLVKHIRTLAK